MGPRQATSPALAAADIGVINKQTEAFIANSASTPATPARVNVVGNVMLQALNQEAVLSISGTAASGSPPPLPVRPAFIPSTTPRKPMSAPARRLTPAGTSW